MVIFVWNIHLSLLLDKVTEPINEPITKLTLIKQYEIDIYPPHELDSRLAINNLLQGLQSLL